MTLATHSNPVQDLPLQQPIYLATFRGNALCVADRESYSILDIGLGQQIELFPISQDPPTEGAAPALAAPAIVAVGPAEFLLALHSGTTSLGVFIRHTGEPTRGTIEWSSRVRSLAVEGAPAHQANVDRGFVLALLRNTTIEVHALSDLSTTLQVIPLDPNDIPEPRSLVGFHDRGLDFTGTGSSSSGGSAALERVTVPLLTPLDTSAPPTTPPNRHLRRASSLRSTTASKRHLAPAHTVLLCKHTLLAIQPLTLLVQAEALLARARPLDALALCDDVDPQSETARYVAFRAGLALLGETRFDEAGRCLARAMAVRRGERGLVVDPRVLLRMWPDLPGERMQGDAIEVWRGAEEVVKEAERTIDAIGASTFATLIVLSATSATHSARRSVPQLLAPRQAQHRRRQTDERPPEAAHGRSEADDQARLGGLAGGEVATANDGGDAQARRGASAFPSP
jgi:hypothetical protein